MEFKKTTTDLLELSNTVSKYCVGMEGNVSGKLNTEQFLIKASGHKLSNLDSDGLIIYDFNGNQINNFNKKGSMELGFHTFLLGFSGINFVSHTHPINTLKILCSDYSDDFANQRLFPDQVVFNGVKTCVVPYGKPGEELTELIKEHVNLFIDEVGYLPKLILLKNHGLIACGTSIDECIIITDICEKAANIFIGSIGLGNIHFLNNKQINDLIIDDKEKYRKNLL